MLTACGYDADPRFALTFHILVKRFERLSNSRAGNALCRALNGLVDGLRLDVKRAEIATECNGDMCFHRGLLV